MLFGADANDPPDKNSLSNDCENDVLFDHTFLKKGSINTNWILLDNGSSINMFSNPQLLTDIHESERSTKIHCNAGVVEVSHMGTVPG